MNTRVIFGYKLNSVSLLHAMHYEAYTTKLYLNHLVRSKVNQIVHPQINIPPINNGYINIYTRKVIPGIPSLSSVYNYFNR